MLTVRRLPSCSKFWSILISIIRSPRPIAVVQWVGILAVFAGLGLSILDKYQKQKARMVAKAKAAKQE